MPMLSQCSTMSLLVKIFAEQEKYSACPSAAPCLKWLHTLEPVAPIFLRFSASVPSQVWIGSLPTCTTIVPVTGLIITTDSALYAQIASLETSST